MLLLMLLLLPLLAACKMNTKHRTETNYCPHPADDSVV